MEFFRKPTISELKLIKFLINKSSAKIPANWKEDLLVYPMCDGGMGGLRLLPHGIIEKNRLFGEQVSDYQFTDSDGVEVIASLNIDTNGNLFELEIWKTDYTQLLKYPVIQ